MRRAIERLRDVTETLHLAQDNLEAAQDAFDFETENEQFAMLSKAVEAIEQARSGRRFFCVDCGKNTLGGEYYMVRDELWAASGLEPNDGMLCLACLEKRIGRLLTLEDFAAVVPSRECWERHVAHRDRPLSSPEAVQLNLLDEAP